MDYGWRKVVYAADCKQCECCDGLICHVCNIHYNNCDCFGPHQEGLERVCVDGVEYARLEPEVEYRFLEIGETVQEGDEYHVWGDKWCTTAHNIHSPCKVVTKNFYRRKVKATPVFNCEGRTEIRDKDGNLVAVSYPAAPAMRINVQECECGRRKIRHYVLGLICEDCEIKWKDPY